jgi:hypothetical protein
MLSYKYPSQDQIPAQHRDLYVPRDGVWVLEVEGAVDQARLDEVQALNKSELEKLTAERGSLQARLADIQIDQGILAAATARGLRRTAIPDITARARCAFRLVEGQPRIFADDGTTVRPGKNGPMTIAEWIDTQVADAPHLFESNTGAGAAGGASAPLAALDNPWNPQTFNLTKQCELMRQDPAKARALMQSVHPTQP